MCVVIVMILLCDCLSVSLCFEEWSLWTLETYSLWLAAPLLQCLLPAGWRSHWVFSPYTVGEGSEVLFNPPSYFSPNMFWGSMKSPGAVYRQTCFSQCRGLISGKEASPACPNLFIDIRCTEVTLEKARRKKKTFLD